MSQAAPSAANLPADQSAQPANGAGQQQVAAAPQVAVAPQVHRPDGLDPQFIGNNDRETIDRLLKAYMPLRQEQSRRVAPPTDANGYALEFGDDLKPFFSKADDPALKHMKAAALKQGITNPQLQGLLNDMLGPMVKEGLLTPFNPQAEIETLQKALNVGNDAAGKAAIDKAVKDANAYAELLERDLNLPEAAKGAFMVMADTASGALALKALAAKLGAPELNAGGAAAGVGGWTKENLKAAMADPRTDPRSPKFDKTYAAAVDAGYKQVYGNG